LAEYSAPTEAELADADAVVGKYLPKEELFADKSRLWLPAMGMVAAVLMCVCISALLATLAFRGGLVLLIAGVTFVRKDGQRASRLRLLWRALVTWSPSFVAFVGSTVALDMHWSWGPWVALAVVGLLAAWSVALPGRGLQDRLAGTWPVPR
jgi:hypothetical protein